MKFQTIIVGAGSAGCVLATRLSESAQRSVLLTYFHPVGTCRMGPATDSMAVVNSRGQVHGIEGLFVTDASIMPAIPAGNTNLPTLMVAERCSARLLEDRVGSA